MPEISKVDARELIQQTFNAFSGFLERNEHKLRGRQFDNVSFFLSNFTDWRRIVGRADIMNDLFRNLDAESYNYLLQQCFELADLYRLSTRDRLVGAVVKYGVAEVGSVTPTGISVENVSVPESGVAIQQNAAAPRSWRNNGNGTFTAEGGATLGGLFGGNWRERSGWPDGRVPEILRVGETVGRNDLLIRHFDDNLAVPIVSRFGEYALACIRAFIIHNVAYPVRRVSDSAVAAFFAEYGVELIVNDLSGDKFDATIINLPQGRTGRIAAVREWGRARVDAARDFKRAGVDAVRNWRRRAGTTQNYNSETSEHIFIGNPIIDRDGNTLSGVFMPDIENTVRRELVGRMSSFWLGSWF
jgi:hypothetical protein